MKLYRVAIPRIIYDLYEVEADSPIEATKKATSPKLRRGDGVTSWHRRLVEDQYNPYPAKQVLPVDSLSFFVREIESDN